MNTKLKSSETDELFKALMLLENTEECYNFFEDLCTVTELKSLSQRFHVAKLLSEGKTYIEVGELTGASTATISRISKCLMYGADGYNLILKRLQAAEKAEKDALK